MLQPRSHRHRPSSQLSKIGIWGIVALVGLRVCVGWHFYMEGTAKVRDGGFSSQGFLVAAKGPLASSFQSLVPDFDGKLRLDAGKFNDSLQKYTNQVVQRYRFDEKQQEAASIALANAISRAENTYAESRSKIAEYNDGFARIAQLKNDPKRSGVESLRQQRDDIESKWRALVKPVLSEIDKTGLTLQKELLSVATAKQRSSVGDVIYKGLGQGLISTSFVDKFIPIFDMSVGILLIIGLLTPVAGVAAGLFLLSVVLTQFPGSAGSQPTYYQAIEMVACFVVAFADAGRFAGLDFIPWSFWQSRAKAKVAA